MSEVTKRQQKNLRDKIIAAAEKIVPRLCDNALGELKDKEGNKTEMSPSMVKSAEAILSRSVPTLQSTEYVERKDSLTESEQIDRLKALVQKNPDLLKTLNKIAEQGIVIPIAATEYPDEKTA